MYLRSGISSFIVCFANPPPPPIDNINFNQCMYLMRDREHGLNISGGIFMSGDVFQHCLRPCRSVRVLHVTEYGL